MRRLAVFAAALSLLGTATAPARAAGDCPDGDWFCEPAPAGGPESEPGSAPADEAAPRDRERAHPRRRDFEPPPPPARLDDEERRVRIDVERVRPAHRRHRRGFREWGINLHGNVGL